MHSNSFGLDLRIDVSQITIRLEEPRPVTYALIALVLALASMSRTRPGGTACPAACVSRTIDSVSCGYFSRSGANLLNSGSMYQGAMNTTNNVNGIAPSHA